MPRHAPRPRACLAIALAVAGSATGLPAQENWTYRARASAESTATRTNSSRRQLAPPAGGWDASGLFLGTGDVSWQPGERLRLAAGGSLSLTGSAVDAGLREAYARIGATSWMDLEAGKRLLRWGVGYGYSPTGVLDPPRTATDPTDRLGRNAGTWMARADVFRGATSLTLAAAAPSGRPELTKASDRLAAARLRTIVGAGMEIALIGAAGGGGAPAYGGNVTHVIGQQLEWHGELLAYDRDDGARTFSAAAGLQYTFTAGVNVVVEYHRKGNGLDDAQWDAVMRGVLDPGAAPSRRQFLFFRAAAAGAERRLAPELIVVAGLDDGGWTFVPAVTWTVRNRVQLYARVTQLAGPRRSLARSAPRATTVTAGSTVRF